MAGIANIRWQDETLRSLWISYQSQQMEVWDHTTAIVASLRMKKGASPLTYHPYRQQSVRRITPQNIDALSVFL